MPPARPRFLLGILDGILEAMAHEGIPLPEEIVEDTPPLRGLDAAQWERLPIAARVCRICGALWWASDTPSSSTWFMVQTIADGLGVPPPGRGTAAAVARWLAWLLTDPDTRDEVAELLHAAADAAMTPSCCGGTTGARPPRG